jgi:ribonucleotide reductase beta subunit family protein with ferritin-like domain
MEITIENESMGDSDSPSLYDSNSPQSTVRSDSIFSHMDRIAENENILHTIKLTDQERRDPIYMPTIDRYGSFTDLDKYPQFVKHDNRQKNGHWTAHDITVKAEEIMRFNKAKEVHRTMIKKLLCMFVVADGVVTEALTALFVMALQPAPVRNNVVTQGGQEVIHQDAYRVLLNSYMRNEKERMEVFTEFHKSGPLKDLVDWAVDYIYSDSPTSEKIIAFAAFEGVAFYHTFVEIAILADKYDLTLMRKFNEYIFRDETYHWMTYVYIIRALNPETRPSQECAHGIMKSMIKAIDAFQDWVIPDSIEGVDKEEIKKYSRWMADKILSHMFYDTIYDVTVNIQELEYLRMEGKTNFLEDNNVDYSEVSKDTNHLETVVDLEEEF